MSASLTRARAEIESLKARAKSARARASKSAGMVQRDATTVAGAYAYGAMRKGPNPTIPNTIMGVDADTAVVATLYMVAHFASGTVAEVAHDAAVGIASALAYSKGHA